VETKRARRLLRKLGFESMEVIFSGSGDSGDIDDSYVTHPHHPAQNFERIVPDWLTAILVEKQVSAQSARDAYRSLKDAAMEVAHGGPDWWNNEGGNGSVVINLRNGDAVLTVNQATITYDTSSSHLKIGE
jgi:hypothetical protein